MKAANTEIVNALATDKTTMTTKRGVKRKAANNHYTPEVCAKIVKYATEHGNVAAARKFSQQLEMDVKESAVRVMKKKYLLQVKVTKDVPVTELTPEKRGRPLLLGEIDKDVADHIRSIREAGGIVNQAIVIATAHGLVKRKNPTLLSDAGGPLHIDKTWAVSFLKRLGYVKRKGTKAARKLPEDFDHQKSEFLRIIKETVTKYSIPPQLIFNFDQIGLKIVPVSNWTMTSEGSEQVAIIGLEDKREITALLGSTADGSLLPPQILYQGKTDQCHAKYPFPDDWDVSHTDNHWSNVDSMIRYIKNVLVPYTDKVKEELDLPIRQHAVAVFDVFRAHRCEEVLDALSKARIQHVFVPAGCTELQPMDLSVNGELKTALKNEFTNWYADKIAKDVQDDASKKVDLRISILKPLHAKWLCKVFHDLKSKKDHILLGWKKSSISDCIV